MGKVFLAGEVKAKQWEDFIKAGVKRRLISFHYHPTYDEAMQMSYDAGLQLFLDSGAFSAFTQGITIDPEKYASFLLEHGDKFYVRSNIDFIGSSEEGAQKTYDNQKLLESMGVKIHPVFHIRERTYWLERYIAEGYDYILVGGLVPETSGWLMEKLTHLFDEVLCNPDGTAKVKLHGFGLTDQKLMYQFPWHSVDSSSFVQTAIYGGCMLETPKGVKKITFSDDSPEIRKLSGWHFKTLSAPQQTEVRKWLDPTGVTAEECMESYLHRMTVCAYTYQRMENGMTDRFTNAQGLFF